MDCRWYLVDVWRQRVDYPTLKAKVVELANNWKATRILVEEAARRRCARRRTALPDFRRHCSQAGSRQDLARVGRFGHFEAGHVYLPERATWLPELEAELFAFPGSRHDDQCNSISQALNDDGSNSLALYIKAWS